MNTTNKKIIARFPPSPTGWFHIGNARTALFNYIFIKKNNGQLKFRLEDTDVERSKDVYGQDIIEGLKWLGIDIDFSNIYKQSEHGDLYKKYISKMISDGTAYISKEEVKEAGQRAEVIRIKNPGKKIVFEDMIRGMVEVDTTELGDFVIAKSINEPIYHFAVVIDDYEMGISHIIRGEDGIYNTPRQILIQEALDIPRPIYAHMPFILNNDRSKLSKRQQGETVSLKYYREKGYLPEAMVNFLAFMGWNPGNDQEIMTMDEIINKFDIKKVQKSGAIFNVEKLNWLNKEYIKKISNENFISEILKNIPEFGNFDREVVNKIVPLLKDKITVFSDLKNMRENGEIDYIFSKPKNYIDFILWPKNPDKEKTKAHLVFTMESFEKIGEWNMDNIKNSIWKYAEENGKGDVLWPLRVSLSGKEKSPDPITLADILGKKETIDRINTAINLL